MAKDKDEVIKLEGKKYKKTKFIIEETHPVIGRILIIDDKKFKIMDESAIGEHRSGTFIAPLTGDDEERMQEYDEDLENLSEKLAGRVDIKKLIKENIKNKKHQEIKTGLFILNEMEKGNKSAEEEHIKGCYQYVAHYKNHSFDFFSGAPPEVIE